MRKLIIILLAVLCYSCSPASQGDVHIDDKGVYIINQYIFFTENCICITI